MHTTILTSTGWLRAQQQFERHRAGFAARFWVLPGSLVWFQVELDKSGPARGTTGGRTEAAHGQVTRPCAARAAQGARSPRRITEAQMQTQPDTERTQDADRAHSDVCMVLVECSKSGRLQRRKYAVLSVNARKNRARLAHAGCRWAMIYVYLGVGRRAQRSGCRAQAVSKATTQEWCVMHKLYSAPDERIALGEHRSLNSRNSSTRQLGRWITYGGRRRRRIRRCRSRTRRELQKTLVK